MFSDPIYGGNVNFAGWDLIGYSGIKLVWDAEDQALDAIPEPEHVSVAEYRRIGVMSNPLPKTDVVIIGLGVAGGIAADVFTRAGINVVGLEAGPWRDKKGIPELLRRASGLSIPQSVRRCEKQSGHPDLAAGCGHTGRSAAHRPDCDGQSGRRHEPLDRPGLAVPHRRLQDSLHDHRKVWRRSAA